MLVSDPIDDGLDGSVGANFRSTDAEQGSDCTQAILHAAFHADWLSNLYLCIVHCLDQTS